MVLSLTLSAVGLAALSLPPTYAQPPPPFSQPPMILRISFSGPQDLRSLTGRLDVWEVHHDEGYIIALAPPAEQARLAAEGRTVNVHPGSFHPDTIPDYPCYRTIVELYADLQTIHADHPAITELIDIGDSFEGRNIWVIRITNQAITATKPIFFLIANIHGRELITNETAMVFVDYLTDNYGVDPDVTWLVDHHEIHVSVSANPDGHVKNEPGQPWAWWRKNANDNFCTGGSEGVDLNRNSTFDWNSCPASWYCSSGSECSEVFRGPSAGSEAEIQAVENYARSIFPDQRDDPFSAAVPLTATGVFITLHSYSNLVLWPWGSSYDPAPNDAGLSALGEKMATFNGYTPKQASGFYPTDGCTDDTTYGELGIASYTFEIGSSSDGFYPSCSRYDALIQPNILAFTYAAKVARTPYLTSYGPDALNVTASLVRVLSSALVTATVSDADNGNQGVAAAEFYVDVPPWDGGVPAAMSASDGAFDGVSETVEATLDTTGLSPGRHILFVRGQDTDGYWGPFSATWLKVHTSGVTVEPVAAALMGDPGATVTYTLRITNTGDYTDSYEIAVTGHTWPTVAVPNPVLDLGPDASADVTVSVTVSPSALAGERDVATVTVTSQGDGLTSGNSVLTTTANAVYGVLLTPETAALGGDLNSAVTYTLQVSNSGNITDTYSLSRLSSGWPTTFSPSGIFTLGVSAWRSIGVYVTTPVTGTRGEQDVATVQVAGTGVSDTSTLTTTAAPYRVYLYFVVRNYP